MGNELGPSMIEFCDMYPNVPYSLFGGEGQVDVYVP